MMVIHTGDIQQDRLGIDPLDITRILWRGNGLIQEQALLRKMMHGERILPF